jgi:hypothetical protein
MGHLSQKIDFDNIVPHLSCLQAEFDIIYALMLWI